MKKRNTKLILIGILAIMIGLVSGCGDTASISENTTPETTEASDNVVSETESEDQSQQLDWTELGLLETNPYLREAFEKIFKTTGTTGNKEGIIYETPTSSTDTTYTYDNNNTLDVAIHNYNFRSLYDSQQSEIADAARNNFIDLEDEDDTTAIASAINSYFNLLPDTDDGNSNPNETLTRAQAMAAIMRAITPVSDDLQSDSSFESAVGTSEYNIFAQSLNDSAFLNTTDGSLSQDNYTGKMTRGEAIYLLMNKFFQDAMKEDNASKYPGLTFDDCIDGGEYTADTNANVLKQMLDESSTHKVDSRIYNAMVLAQFYGILDAGESNWDAAITKAEFITLLVNTLREENTTMERFNAPDGVTDLTDAELLEIDITGDFEKVSGLVDGCNNPELVPTPLDYGKSIKSMDDLPNVTCYGWDFEKHPVYYGYTTKGYMCCVDGLNNMTYYANMMDPTGCMFGGDKEKIALINYMEEKGYDNSFEVTYEEAKELFGEADMSTMVNLADGDGWAK